MFIDVPFPECLAFGAVSTPTWNTDVSRNQGGWEQRNSIWTYALHSYDVSTAVQTKSDYQAGLAHFNEVRGRLHSFPLKDPLDFEVTLAEGVLITTDDAGVFQLAKKYGVANPYLRKITRPFEPLIYEDGTLKVGGYSLDLITGLITFPGAIGAMTWTGEFRVPVRYGNDQLPGQVVDKGGDELYVQATSIILQEVRE